MARRHLFITVGVVALAFLGLVLAVSAAQREGQRFDGRVGRQAALVRDEATTTGRTSFEAIPGLSGEVIKNRGMYTVTFSGEITGGPAEIRIRGARPAAVVFHESQPGGAGTSSDSFTFVDKAANEGTCTTISAEWRSVDGTPVTLESGSVVVTYRYVGDKRAKSIGCV